MPPKGWRKNGESALAHAETDLVSIDDILFPRLTIQKLAKMPLADDNMSLAKDSLIAVQRAATVFVSHLLFHARLLAKEKERKNVNAQDILAALEKADLSGFLPEVKQRLSTYEEQKTTRKVPSEQGSDHEEPVAKKQKDNSENSVGKTNQEEAEDDGIDAEKPAPDTDAVEEAEEEEAEEAAAPNPIALLNQEEDELQGSEAAAVEESVENDSD